MLLSNLLQALLQPLSERWVSLGRIEPRHSKAWALELKWPRLSPSSVTGSLSKACNHQRPTHSFLCGVALGHAKEGKITQDAQNITLQVCAPAVYGRLWMYIRTQKPCPQVAAQLVRGEARRTYYFVYELETITYNLLLPTFLALEFGTRI